MRRLGFNAAPEKSRSKIFGFNENWKNRFPIEKYLMMPELERKQRRLEEFSARNPENLNASGDMEYDMLADRFNPYDPNHVGL